MVTAPTPTDLTALKSHFTRFLGAVPGRLHFVAHSHHPWPDVSLQAQQLAWQDAAELMDKKWERVFGEVMPAAQEHVRRLLNLPNADTVAFAPNTHELVKRVFSCLEQTSPIRVLTSGSEFHAFERQTRRWEEAGVATTERVPAEPFDTFTDRFREAVRSGDHDLIYISQVFFNSGWVVEDLDSILEEIPDSTYVIVDGYHAFCALPVDWSRWAHRVFYAGGGYKYAMSGEGVCFLHCPPGWGERPVDTGWFAGFGKMEESVDGVPYSRDGNRFLGSTVDPTGLYRFRAVQDLWRDEGITVDLVHRCAQHLQRDFIRQLEDVNVPGLSVDHLVPGADVTARGNFLTFRTENAGALHAKLAARNIVVDRRGDRIRFGFGIYQDARDVKELIGRLGTL